MYKNVHSFLLAPTEEIRSYHVIRANMQHIVAADADKNLISLVDSSDEMSKLHVPKFLFFHFYFKCEDIRYYDIAFND